MRIIFTIAAMTLVFIPHARGAEPMIVTLSCDGKVEDLKRHTDDEAISKLGVVVNLGEQNVSFNGYVIPIKKVDAATVYFEGKSQQQTYGVTTETDVTGSVDRITGAMTASTMTTAVWLEWELYCKSVTRVF